MLLFCGGCVEGWVRVNSVSRCKCDCELVGGVKGGGVKGGGVRGAKEGV